MTTRIKSDTAANTCSHTRPIVQIVGATGHPDFRGVIDVLHREAGTSTTAPPELVVVLQERPGVIGECEVEALRRQWPLAGFVAVAGSWCEGELRTGRPLAGVPRVYWHQFPAWWRRQLARRAAGLCPEWSLPIEESVLTVVPAPPAGRGGLIVVSTPQWETADALSDAFQSAGYATSWSPQGRDASPPVLRGVVAGVWDGGQLVDREAASLKEFVTMLSHQSAPAIALLDFPRWDSVTIAQAAGAAAVLGKPWLAADLIDTTENARQQMRSAPGSLAIARAA
jgi:hypothetical protein